MENDDSDDHDNDYSHNVNENNDLDELMLKQLSQQRRSVHRRSDGYERRHIYRGAVVKREKNDDNLSSNEQESTLRVQI
ncbi:MAG: hypothetical protein ACT6FD_05935 [Methanosarcinaceae archaeon]